MPIEKECCVKGCYREALFGEDCNLMRGVMGRWRCWPHHKEHVQLQQQRKQEEEAERARKAAAQGSLL